MNQTQGFIFSGLQYSFYTAPSCSQFAVNLMMWSVSKNLVPVFQVV